MFLLQWLSMIEHNIILFNYYYIFTWVKITELMIIEKSDCYNHHHFAPGGSIVNDYWWERKELNQYRCTEELFLLC